MRRKRRRGGQSQFRRAHRGTRIAFMRYVGQGHEIPVPLPARVLAPTMSRRCARVMTRIHPVPRSAGARFRCGDHELRRGGNNGGRSGGWVRADDDPPASDATANGTRLVRDTTTGEVAPWSVFDRVALAAGARVAGPAIIAEDRTSTLIGQGSSGTINEARLYPADQRRCGMMVPRSPRRSGAVAAVHAASFDAWRRIAARHG